MKKKAVTENIENKYSAKIPSRHILGLMKGLKGYKNSRISSVSEALIFAAANTDFQLTLLCIDESRIRLYSRLFLRKHELN